MLTEPDYLPFSASAVPDGPWLILAPHPDDETFGMGGALALAAQRDLTVRIIVLTDGARGGSGHDLVARREVEAVRAVSLLGHFDVEFWREPDRGLEVTPQLVTRLAREIANGGYRCVYFPMPGEPHPDHRAAASLAWEALCANGFRAEPWSYEISIQGVVNTLLDITGVLEVKKAAISAYVSQDAAHAYLGRVLGLNASRAWSLPLSVSHAEGFFRWPPLRSKLWVVWRQMLMEKAKPEAFGFYPSAAPGPDFERSCGKICEATDQTPEADLMLSRLRDCEAELTSLKKSRIVQWRFRLLNFAAAMRRLLTHERAP